MERSPRYKNDSHHQSINLLNHACFQVLAHKNLNHFDRTRWIERAAMADRITLPGRRPDWNDTPASARAFSTQAAPPATAE